VDGGAVNAEQVRDAAPTPAANRRPWRARVASSMPPWAVLALRGVLLGLVSVVVLASFFVTPTRESAEQLRADLAAGDVTWLAFSDDVQSEGPFAWSFSVGEPDSNGSVIWRAGGDIALHAASVGDLAATYLRELSGAGDGVYVEESTARRAASALEHEARGAGVAISTTEDTWLLRVAQWDRWLYFSALLLLLLGPQPRRATKWGVVWLLTLPFNVGLLWWLLREAPWSRRALAEPAPLAHYDQRNLPESDGRLTGGWACLLTVAAGLAAGLAFNTLL
jgi:hypothetical protein